MRSLGRGRLWRGMMARIHNRRAIISGKTVNNHPGITLEAGSLGQTDVQLDVRLRGELAWKRTVGGPVGMPSNG